MKTDITKAAAEAAEATLFLGDDWFDPLEAGVRTRIRGFVEELLEAERDAALGRDRDERPRLAEKDAAAQQAAVAGHRHGHRERGLMGTFGAVTVRVPRGRLETPDGKAAEWKNATIPIPAAHQTGQRADRRRLFCLDQHAPGAAGARGFVRRRRGPLRRAQETRSAGRSRLKVPEQAQPVGIACGGLAQGKGRLGCLEWPFARQ